MWRILQRDQGVLLVMANRQCREILQIPHQNSKGGDRIEKK
jgi:hypothetical protein